MSEPTAVDTVLANTRHIYDLVDACVGIGVTRAVLCPGSRCAPLLIGFGRHSAIESISVTDERSAGFIALGIAQQRAQPVVLVCTSGSAAQNFAPAVTEAFYQQVPLLVLTADRPPRWIDQWDGQTIHQQNLYGPHVKDWMTFIPGSASLRDACQLLRLAVSAAAGPVHINIPLEQPFYPNSLHDVPPPAKQCAGEDQHRADHHALDDKFAAIRAEVESAQKLLILAGQHEPQDVLKRQLAQSAQCVTGDMLSNMVSDCTEVLFDTDDENLRPDVLLSFGRSVISQKQKQYFRRYKPDVHWHIGVGMVGDPFQTLTGVLPVTPQQFFERYLAQGWQRRPQQRYRDYFAVSQARARAQVTRALSSDGFNQFSAIQQVLASLPAHSVLHLANSMAVRSACLVGLPGHNVEVWCNRGTSGIDGCVSTAVGHALARSDKIHSLICGDLAFFYDRNGLWLNRQLPDNLRIFIINNGGGGIFRLIPGPRNIESLSDLFTAPHQRDASLSAQEFGLEYHRVEGFAALNDVLGRLDQAVACLVEIMIDPQQDERVYKQIMGLT